MRFVASATLALFLGLSSLDAAAADKAVGDYRAAVAAAAAGRHVEASRLAPHEGDPLLAKVLLWMRLGSNGEASFDEIAQFIRDNPRWPGLTNLQRAAEEAITAQTPNQVMLRWFSEYPPITANGRIAFGEALMRAGQEAAGREVLRQAWVASDFGVLQERQFWARHGKLLTAADNRARLDRLLWNMDLTAARRMLLRVDKGHSTLARARISLLAMQGGVTGALAAVPAALRDDAGLIYARLRWRRMKDLDNLAVELLRHPAANEVRPAAWWTERSIVVRRLLKAGETKTAYRLARDHGQTESVTLAEGEWLAGWIALRFLNDPKTALGHFERLYASVSTPISRSRGAYWAARAAEAQKDKDAAEHWYGLAAEHVTTFYGQLAAERLGRQPPLPPDPAPEPEEIAEFRNDELVRVVERLGELELGEQITPFVLRLNALAGSPGQRALVAALANETQRRDLAVHLARRSDVNGTPMLGSGYPRLSDVPISGAENELIHALIRQESGFRPVAVSSAGAQGLMQILPSTASRVAKALKVSFSKDRLREDPAYNVAIGSAYLTRLIDEFEGSYVLGLAAYNAGPARVRAWLKDYGDPRRGQRDPVDWIESIPYPETRNYVQRVLEGLQVYRRLQDSPMPTSLNDDLMR